MTPDQQIEQIELSIEQAKSSIDMRDALRRLNENKDFKKVIVEGYFEKEASRVVLLKADPNTQDTETQDALDKSIIAIGQLRQYMRTIFQVGGMADGAMGSHEEALEEIHSDAIEV